MTSASRTGKLNLKEVRLIEMRWKAGSLGFAFMRAAAAVADAAPIRAEVQLHFTVLPMPLQKLPLFFAVDVRRSRAEVLGKDFEEERFK